MTQSLTLVEAQSRNRKERRALGKINYTKIVGSNKPFVCSKTQKAKDIAVPLLKKLTLSKFKPK